MKKFYLIILFAFLASLGSYITAAETWTKVTTALTDWSGDYLIVYEDGNVAFDGSLSKLDAARNIQSVTISDGTITTDGCKFYFTIKPATTAGKYTIKSASGRYIGRPNNGTGNGLSSSTSTPYTNTLSLTGGNISIKSSAGTCLQYNSDKNQKWFRYFSSNQKAIQLYKKAAADQVATPKFDVASGYSNYEAVTASATTATEGATVHYSYTKNGVEQTHANDTEAPVLSTVGTYVVTAIAKDATGKLKDSYPATATYTITAPAAPTADPKPGTYNEATIIKFTSTEGTIVRVKRGDEYFTPVKNIFTKELTAVNGEKTTYTFEVWTEYNDNNSVRVFYTYIIDPNAKNDIFARINSVEHFAANDEVIIVSEKAGMIMSTYENNGFKGKPDSVEGSYTIPLGDNEISILTIENGKAGTYKLKCADGKYLNLSNGEVNITKNDTGSENEISFKGNNVSINNDNSRSIAWRAGSTKLFKHYSNSNINDSQYFHVQLYKKLTGDGNLTARLRYHQNNDVIDAEENVADGMTYENIGAILLSSETAVNYALVGEGGTQIGTTEPGKTSVLTFPGVGKYILATSNKVISFTIGSVVSGVETIAADAAKVYGAAGNIVVEAETAADVNVYNAAGMLVAAQKVGAGRTNIALAKGFYVVRAGNTVTKVAVR